MAVSATAANVDCKAITTALSAAGRDFYSRGWVLGTSGNFSALLSRNPLRIIVTISGAAKGQLRADQFVTVDADGSVVSGSGRPSAETLLHATLYRACGGVGAVLHTHSIWGTLLSGKFASAGGMSISGFEMLKGLAGAVGHQHEEWVPILENSQIYWELSATVSDQLIRTPQIHGFLLARHGLYTWGRDVEEARRHVEVLEFLFELLGRQEARWR